MAKKGGAGAGENSRKAAGQARKADSAANKKAAEESKKAVVEDAEWDKGSKKASAKKLVVMPAYLIPSTTTTLVLLLSPHPHHPPAIVPSMAGPFHAAGPLPPTISLPFVLVYHSTIHTAHLQSAMVCFSACPACPPARPPRPSVHPQPTCITPLLPGTRVWGGRGGGRGTGGAYILFQLS